MKNVKKLWVAVGIVLIFLSLIIGAVERVFQPGTFVPAAVGTVLIFFCVVWDWLARHKIFKIFMLFLFATGMMLYFVAECFIFSGVHPPETGAHEYAVVLGCGLFGEAPSWLLAERLKTAEQYARQYPDCKLILSGGQGCGELITEAEAMRRYLVSAGISQERLILEEHSHNTFENLRNSNRILDENDGEKVHDCIIISNNFHLYRAKRLAKIIGMNSDTLAAPTPVGTVGMFLREGISVLFSWLRYH